MLHSHGLRLYQASSRSVRSWTRPRARLHVEALEDRTVPSTAYLLIKTTANSTGALLAINTDDPTVANLGAAVPISNTNGQRILGIDFRPDNGVLYGMSEASRLYAINPATGVASLLGAPGATTMDPFTGVFQGIATDFNPLVDALRIIEDDGLVNGQDDNFSVNPNTGVFTQQSDLGGAATDVDIAGVAYTNNVPAATLTTLYGIETNQGANDRLVTINPPASGALTDVDSNANGLGVVVGSQEIGFDIISDRDVGNVNRAFATLQVGTVFNLYGIDLAAADGGTGTGDATLVGSISTAAAQTAIPGFAVRGMALVLPGATLAVGRGPGGASQVRTFDVASRVPENIFNAFAGNAGATVALGHFNGDGILDIVVGAGAGAPPRVKVIDGNTRAVLANFLAYPPGFTGGVFVAAADVDGDQVTDFITGAGPGAGAGRQVKAINGTRLQLKQANGQIKNVALFASFYAFGAGFTGGTTVAAGDVNADGRADIITGKFSGAGHVKVVNAANFFDAFPDTNAKGEIRPAAVLANRIAFGGAAGVFVASADMNFDGRAEVIISVGRGGAGRVVVRNVQDNLTANQASFLAFPNSNKAGARIAAVDADANGVFDIVVGTGAGVAEQLRVFNAFGQLQLVFPPVFGGKRGVFVGGR